MRCSCQPYPLGFLADQPVRHLVLGHSGVAVGRDTTKSVLPAAEPTKLSVPAAPEPPPKRARKEINLQHLLQRHDMSLPFEDHAKVRRASLPFSLTRRSLVAWIAGFGSTARVSIL